MRVESSQVSLWAAHRASETHRVVERRVAQTPGPMAQVMAADRVELSARAVACGTGEREDLRGMDARQVAAALAIEAVVGHRITWRRLEPGGAGGGQEAEPLPPVTAASGPSDGQAIQQTEVHTESEQTRFEAAGAVETADGRTIRFAVSLGMKREFVSATTTTINAAPPPPGSAPRPAARDPLVVNFGGAPARLTDAKVRFDLDSNGEATEEISFVTTGSGFLVLDANGDGQANNGRELFGPQTGDGFAELARYDADGNQWIDEADPVFTKLRIWTAGEGLTTLADRGIGAISVSSAQTQFDLKSTETNQMLGAVRRTGVYLGEDGAAGTVQHVDLAVT